MNESENEMKVKITQMSQKMHKTQQITRGAPVLSFECTNMIVQNVLKRVY